MESRRHRKDTGCCCPDRTRGVSEPRNPQRGVWAEWRGGAVRSFRTRPSLVRAPYGIRDIACKRRECKRVATEATLLPEPSLDVEPEVQVAAREAGALIRRRHVLVDMRGVAVR